MCFVQISAVSTVLYENSALFKLLIFNVINIEKYRFARMHENIIVVRVGYFLKRNKNKKRIYYMSLCADCEAMHNCPKRL